MIIDTQNLLSLLWIIAVFVGADNLLASANMK